MTSSSSQVVSTTVEQILNDVQFVRFQWNDLTNMIRYRVIPIKYFKKLLTQQRPGIAITVASMGLVYVQLAEGFEASGEYLYVVDLSSLRPCGYAPGHASVMGYFQVKDPTPGQPLDVLLCPRSLLYKTVESAKREHGIEFKMGFETEVIFLKSVLPIEVVNDYGWSVSSAIPSGSKEAAALEEIAHALDAAGVELEMYHAEGAPGQYEFVCGHLAPLQAVDALITTRETIYNIAAKYGFRATLAPRLHMDSCGSAAHMHFSIQSKTTSPSANVEGAPHLSRIEASFLQSLLDHLPGICALSLPTNASYARMMDGVWSGGTYVSWGKENRESPVRLCGVAPNHHFEVRCLDGTANAYVAIAAMLGCGMLGVRDKLNLTVKGTQAMAASLSDTERKQLGITKRLPLNLAQARDYLKHDKALVDLLGGEFVRKYLSVNKLLSEALDAPDHDTRTKKIVEMY